MNKKRKSNTAVSIAAVGASTLMLETIIGSFNTASAFAECQTGGYDGVDNLCVNSTPDEVCMVEQSTFSVEHGSALSVELDAENIDGSGFGWDSGLVVPTRGEILETTAIPGLTITSPTDVFFNSSEDYYTSGFPSPSNTDGETVTLPLDFNSPAVSFLEGRNTYTAEATGSFYDVWMYQPYNDYSTGTFTIHVDHANLAPEITSISPDIDLTVSSRTLSDVDVFAVIEDVESNTVDLTVEISEFSDFSIPFVADDTVTGFTTSDTGETFNYTFTDLPVGNYHWRITATETDALGTCTDMPAFADPAINLDDTSTIGMIDITGTSSGGGKQKKKTATPTPTPTEYIPISAGCSNIEETVQLFNDDNGNGAYDQGESLISDTTITVRDGAGNTSTAQTNSNGEATVTVNECAQIEYVGIVGDSPENSGYTNVYLRLESAVIPVTGTDTTLAQTGLNILPILAIFGVMLLGYVIFLMKDKIKN